MFSQDFVLPLFYFCGRASLGYGFKHKLPKLHTYGDICWLVACVWAQMLKSDAL